MIKQCPKLHSLNLSDSDIGDEGSLKIIQHLKDYSKNLKSFFFNFNELEDNAKNVLQICIQMSQLRVIFLSYNKSALKCCF